MDLLLKMVVFHCKKLVYQIVNLWTIVRLGSNEWVKFFSGSEDPVPVQVVDLPPFTHLVDAAWADAQDIETADWKRRDETKVPEPFFRGLISWMLQEVLVQRLGSVGYNHL